MCQIRKKYYGFALVKIVVFHKNALKKYDIKSAAEKNKLQQKINIGYGISFYIYIITCPNMTTVHICMLHISALNTLINSVIPKA